VELLPTQDGTRAVADLQVRLQPMPRTLPNCTVTALCHASALAASDAAAPD
jgi:hypothetical protein